MDTKGQWYTNLKQWRLQCKYYSIFLYVFQTHLEALSPSEMVCGERAFERYLCFDEVMMVGSPLLYRISILIRKDLV